MRPPASTAIGLQASVCAGRALICLRFGAAARRAQSAPQALDPASDTTAGGDRQPDSAEVASLAALAYELLDAHTDTAQLVDGLAYDPSWAAHLDYLRALQRKGREMLARTAPEELSTCRWNDLGSRDVR
jgi:hypothetical protein